MANIKKVELTSVSYWKEGAGAAWAMLPRRKGTNPVVNIGSIVLYDNATGHNPATPLALTMDWANFTDDTEAGCTIFGTVADGMAFITGKKSIRIRYKIKTTSVGDIVTETIGYYYQLINMGFSGSPIAGVPSTATSAISASIVVTCPGFTNDMVISGTAAQIQSYLATAAKWSLVWTAPDGTIGYPAVSAAALGTPSAGGDASYGGYSVPVTLSATLPIRMSGTHTLEVKFNPNDGDTTYAIPVTVSCVATVTVNMAAPEFSTMYSTDSDISMSLSFTQ